MTTYDIVKSCMFKLSPENAHNLIENIFKSVSDFCPFITSFVAKRYFITHKMLEQDIYGMTFLNPIGIAAGFDKNATMIKMLTAFGFGHIEFGTLTPVAQKGNKKPRLFRYVEEESLQNAMGFNNDGMVKIAKRVQKIYPFAIPLGANIGKNKVTDETHAIEDYKKLIQKFKDISDYMVINISSPNTPGLRDLQNEQFIKELFTMAKAISNKPVFLKIAPDLEIEDAKKLCKTAIESGADGIIATNTTIDYTLLKNAQNFGGISGKVLKEKSFKLFEELAKEFYGKTILISVGGIDSADEAYRRIKAGASLIQIYSSFIFKGPSLLKEINTKLIEYMQNDGFANIQEAIGSDRRA